MQTNKNLNFTVAIWTKTRQPHRMIASRCKMAPPGLKFDVILVPPVESEFINLANFRYMFHKPQLT